MGRKQTAASGMGATVVFWAALVSFAAINPAYSHATKAVSELGAVGAPNQVAWNLIGFLLTGLLLAVHGAGIGAVVGSRLTGALFMLSGLSFAATAVPADMDDLSTPRSVIHIVASFAVFGFWIAGAVRVRGQTQEPGQSVARITRWAIWISLGAATLRFTPLLMPGLGQRLSFVAYFGWVAATSVVLWRRASRFQTRRVEGAADDALPPAIPRR